MSSFILPHKLILVFYLCFRLVLLGCAFSMCSDLLNTLEIIYSVLQKVWFVLDLEEGSYIDIVLFLSWTGLTSWRFVTCF